MLTLRQSFDVGTVFHDFPHFDFDEMTKELYFFFYLTDKGKLYMRGNAKDSPLGILGCQKCNCFLSKLSS